MERRRALSVPVGTMLAGKYRVGGVLGSGGMGIVLAAMHVHLREEVAIKLLHPEAAARRIAVERFLREARVAMKLRGQHVVRIFDVGRLEDGSPFIAMECLQGEDFGALLRRLGRLEPEAAVDYVVQACEGVAEAHAHGVIHRDLKPANLFLARCDDGSSSVKVLDFGASKVLVPEPRLGDSFSAVTADASDAHERVDSSRLAFADTIEAPVVDGLTRAGAFVGSPRYMAPEQVRCSHDVDARADVWALGAILYELLCGRPAFEGDSLQKLREDVLGKDPPPLDGVPSGIDAIVRRCLAKDPRDRYESAEALAEALEPWRSKRRPRRAGRALIGAVAAFLAVCAVSMGGVALRNAAMARRAIPEDDVPIVAASAMVTATTPLAATAAATADLAAPRPEPARPTASAVAASPPVQPLRRTVPATHPVVTPPPRHLDALVERDPPPPEADPLRLDAGTLFSSRK